MKFVSIFVVAFAVSSAITTRHNDAQIIGKTGKLIYKKVFGESVKQGSKNAAKRSAIAITKQATRKGLQRSATSAITKTGIAKSSKLVAAYGDDATRAVAKLNPQSARRLAMLGDDIATSPHGGKLMKLIAERGDGDKIMAWLYRNKATIIGGTLLASFVADPDAYLNAGEKVASNITQSAGKYIAKPMIESAVTPIIHWIGIGVGLTAFCGFSYFVFNFRTVRKQPDRPLNNDV